MASSTIFAAHLLDTADRDMDAMVASGKATLATGAKEFAFLTGTRISKIGVKHIYFATPNGLPVGRLERTTPDNKRYYEADKDMVFMFTSCAIVTRARSGRGGSYDAQYQRVGKTIKGMVQSIKKNDTPITEENVTRYLCTDMHQAFYDPLSGINEASIQIQRNLLLPLVKHLLGVDKFSILQHEPQVRQAYEAYLTANKQYLEACENRQRFANGATFIGVEDGNSAIRHPGPFFICTARLKDRVKYGTRGVEFMTPLVRYETLPDEFGGIAAICKAHLPGKGEEVSPTHPFGIVRHNDHYYEDVDVIHEVSSNMRWTVIPTDIAEDAPYVYSL